MNKYQQEVRTAKFGTQCVIKLQKFEWLLVYCHQGSVPRATPTAWTNAYDSTGFAKAERRLFGKANYQYYFGTARGLLGFHQITDPSILALTDFQLENSVLESYYDPHIYLLRGQGLLWYTALTRAQIHSNAFNICSELPLPCDHQGLSELCKEVQVHENDDSTLFTYKAYCKLLHNALDELGINDVPHQTSSQRALNPSQKKTMNKLQCYIWHTLAGPIHNYLNNPLLQPLFKYWFPEMDDFYTTARHFLEDDTEQVTSDQMALIPWVQSIVI
jgi:hypothetical protein